jgi:hypothetical protein
MGVEVKIFISRTTEPEKIKLYDIAIEYYPESLFPSKRTELWVENGKSLQAFENRCTKKVHIYVEVSYHTAESSFIVNTLGGRVGPQ